MTNIKSIVSIITPVFKAEAHLVRAVQSVLAQSYPYWEMLIISDDGINYADVLRKRGISDERLKFYASPYYQSGPNVCRNIAFEQSKGQFIALLEADDIYYPERLEKLLPLAIDHGMSADNVLVVDDNNGQEIGELFQDDKLLFMLSCDQYIQTSTPITFLYDKNIIKNNWDCKVTVGEDVIFNLRAMEQVDKVPVLLESLHEYRINQRSVCYFPNVHEKAEQAYNYCINAMNENHLGFETAYYQTRVMNMLRSKQDLNRSYSQALEEGFTGNFQQFIYSLKNANENVVQTN